MSEQMSTTQAGPASGNGAIRPFQYQASDEALADLEHALALHEKMRSPFHIAYTQTALADALARRGTRDDLDRARTLARGALDIASDRGYGYIVRDAGAVLERLT